MKRIFLLLGIAFCIMLLADNAPAQATIAIEVKDIDAYSKTVDAVRAKRKSAELVFADTSDVNSDQKKWRAFASEQALEKFRKDSETYTIAYNWRSGGKIVASNFTLFSPSGDWVKYLYHYFRPDGTLARVESDYRTFNGDFMVVRRLYFDRYGKQIKQTTKFLDLKTKKSKKPEEGGVMGDDPNEADYYLTVKKLPFAHLLM
jgi:hypothetical protein